METNRADGRVPEVRPVRRAGKLARAPHSGRVVTELREAIVSGRLAAGESLVEMALARERGVSRGPIRNALLELKGEGLVETFANGRAYVTGFERRHLIDLFAVRLELEYLAVSWGVGRGATSDGIVEAHAALARAKGLSRVRMAEADMSFHRTLLEFSGSRSLLRSWLALAPLITTVIVVANRRVGLAPRDLHAFVQQMHAPIVDAIVAGDLPATRALLDDHLKALDPSYPEKPRAEDEGAQPLS